MEVVLIFRTTIFQTSHTDHMDDFYILITVSVCQKGADNMRRLYCSMGEHDGITTVDIGDGFLSGNRVFLIMLIPVSHGMLLLVLTEGLLA